jgi:hypothetical protein
MKEKIKKSQEAIKNFSKKRKIEKLSEINKKEIKAIDQLIYDIFKIWRLDIILPALSIVILLQILKLYFIEILALGLIAYMIYDHFKQPVPVVNHNARYQWLLDYLYDPAKNMSDYLPVTKIQVSYDLFNAQKYVADNNYAIYLYQLAKMTNEEIDDDKLSFAKKILQAQINKKMDAYEHHHNNNGDTFYKDARVIMVDDICDVGTHYLISIIWIDNPQAYQYWQYKNTPKKRKPNDIDDEDF